MAASSGPLWFLIFAAALYSKVTHGFEWEASSPLNGATIKACTRDRISFSWKFSVAVEERVMYAEWHKKTDGIYQILATHVAGFFMKLPTANFSIDFLPNAGIQMSNFTREDYGNYRVSVIYKVNGTLYSESSSVVLELPDTPVLENNRLSAQIKPEPVTDVSTRERHVQLTCGTFLTLGSRPLIVEWRTPSGTIVPSSSYSNGTFYLTLPNPVVGGTYVCRLKDPFLVAGCMINNLNALRQGDYVLVDAVQTRLILLEGSVQDLHAKDSSVDADLDRQEDVDNNLTSVDERLTSRVDDLQQQLVEQKKVDVNQNSDIILLNGELAKHKEVDAALTSNVSEFQEQITEKEKTDEELKTALQSEQAKVRLLEAQISEMKALGLKERLQTEAKWASDLKRIEDKLRIIPICEATPRFQSSCYSAVKKRVTWRTVNDECMSLGGKLAEIESAEERDHVKKIADVSDLIELWLGGTDTDNEGVWKWVSSGSAFNFTDWGKGEPNDALGGEDCFTMVKAQGWTWNDDNCDRELNGALCEFSSPF